MSSTTARDLYAVKTYFDKMDRMLRKKYDFRDNYLCDSTSSDIVWQALKAFKKTGNRRWVMSAHQLGNMLHTTRWHIRKRIKVLAQFGIIKVHNSWKNDGSNKRNPSTIVLNDMLIRVLETGSDKAQQLATMTYLCQMGVRRLESDTPIQGFKTDADFGDEEQVSEPDQSDGHTPEPDEITEDDINALMQKTDEAKMLKAEERKLWLERSSAYVQAAANVWVDNSIRNGNGSARPNWEGDTASLAPAARKERLELVKLFEQYGGKIAGLAWFLFVKGQPTLDKNGKPVFNMQFSHYQFTGPDKKPSSFAKHFNSMLKDPGFIGFSKDEPTTTGYMQKWWGELWDIGPRDGSTTAQKLGYEWGMKDGAALHEVNG